MIWLAILLLLLAIAAAVPLPAKYAHPTLVIPFALGSMLGQIVALPLLIASGVLAAVTGSPAAWIFAAAAGLLALAHWRNRHAGRLLLRATGQAQVRIPLLAGINPFATGRSNVRRIKNICYGEFGKRNFLDVIVPKECASAAMPVLIHIHGGAWVTGDTNQQAKPLLHYLASRGWMCVDVTYRLGPAHRGPDWIVDVLKAIAWVKEHAREYGGDPDRVALTGGSAGGHLTALAALAHDDPAFKPGFEHADCRVTAAVPMYGFYDFLDRNGHYGYKENSALVRFLADKVMPGRPETCPELWSAVSPFNRLRDDAPPMLIVHGSGDSLLPLEDARDFAEALRVRSKAPVRYVELPGTQHAFDIGSSALVWAHVRAVERFLAPLLGFAVEPSASGAGAVAVEPALASTAARNSSNESSMHCP
jgi:acetyl esterase/lipase